MDAGHVLVSTLFIENVFNDPIEVMGIWLDATVSAQFRRDHLGKLYLDQIDHKEIYLSLHRHSPKEFRFHDDLVQLDQDSFKTRNAPLYKAFLSACEELAFSLAEDTPDEKWHHDYVERPDRRDIA